MKILQRTAAPLILITWIAALSSGCSSNAWNQTELYLGMTRPGGADVTDAEFQSFLDEVVTPLFPDGYTVMPAEGRWREQSGVVRTESSRVLIILYRATPNEDRKIERIRDTYKSRFNQEAVLRVDDRADVSF